MLRMLTLLSGCLALGAAASSAAEGDLSPACQEALAVMNSGGAEADWYLAECLHGVPPRVATRAARPEAGPPLPHLQYIHNFRAAGSFPQSLTTAPVGTLTYTLIGAQPRQIFAAGFDRPHATLWGIDNQSHELGTYDLTTGAFTATGLVTGLVAGHNIEALKFDPTSNAVYVSSTNGSSSVLYTLDLGTRVATPVGPITGFNLVVSIAISNSGQIYGHDTGLDQIMLINKATGAGTALGPTGFDALAAQGMDFDRTTNTLWAWLYFGGGSNGLASINLTNGSATLAVTGANGPENQGAIRGLSTIPLVASALSVDAAGNRVMEPGEAASVAPSWHNDGAATGAVTGTLSAFTGPAGGTYTINDGSASYGTIATGATASCGSQCYEVTAGAATRPVTHWDATVLETLSTSETKTWTLHLGGSFTDVPASNGFYPYVETLLHKGVTSGCGGTSYCPADGTTREQMAVFVLVAKEGAGYAPPACTMPMFNDVPASSVYCRFIEELARRGVVAGCGGGSYCPQAAVTRDAMAVFTLRTLDPALDPPACTMPVFNDVPASSVFCRWIEELARRHVVGGCGNGSYCPGDPVTREQMGVFLALTFGLSLYGV